MRIFTHCSVKVSLIAGVCLLLASFVAAEGQRDAATIARQVDERYNRLRSLQADFTEVYTGAAVDRTESGVLYLKKPGKMRWEYRSPKEKVFVSDGKSAWFYLPDERQARKSSLKQLEDLRSPLAFLLGKTKLEKELQGLAMAPDVPALSAGNVVLRGVPKAMADRVDEVVLEITPDAQITRIVIEQGDGSRTEFRMTGQQENVALRDSLFAFSAPAGVEVVEDNFGQ
ncbi:MAG: outer membrane lipoprotein chaperone LolA [Acidobacteriales bacterium]|nr:outer membrane lipoprotein chaperone LolA [Terriglobales bacterium]